MKMWYSTNASASVAGEVSTSVVGAARGYFPD
jgi:hypothetical protein